MVGGAFDKEWDRVGRTMTTAAAMRSMPSLCGAKVHQRFSLKYPSGSLFSSPTKDLREILDTSCYRHGLSGAAAIAMPNPTSRRRRRR